MKVYIVTEIQNYEDHICLGVFANEKDAIQMALECDLNPKHVIKEHEVIE